METESKSLFEPYVEGTAYGMFGYAGKCCDLAINTDNVGMIKECIARGFMNETTKNVPGESMVVMAERRGKHKVERYLRSIGWQ